MNNIGERIEIPFGMFEMMETMREGMKPGEWELITGHAPSYRAYAEELAAMMGSMAIARNTGIGYICLEHTDFTDLELRALAHSDAERKARKIREFGFAYGAGPTTIRKHTENQRGRKWKAERELQENADWLYQQQLAGMVGHVYDKVFSFGEIKEAPGKRTVACRIVKARGKLDTPSPYQYDDTVGTWINNIQ